MRKLLTMREALTSPAHFGGPDMMGGATWAGWRVVLLAVMGEVLTDAEREIYQAITEREREPVEPVREFYGVVGRRGGKSRAMGTLAAYLAGCCDHRSVLAPGQRGRLPIVAASKDQADEVLAYVRGAFAQSSALRGLVENEVERTLSLRSLIDVQVRALSFRNLRGATNIGIILDELAFWRSDESATPDVEVIKALRPSLATTKGPLIAISSPYARKGVLWKAYSRDFGAEGRPSRLVVQASTKVLNPAIDPAFLADAYDDDPVAAAAEFGAEFRSDLADFISTEVVAAAVVKGRHELERVAGVRYVGFVDASGGSSDAMTLGIAHAESGKAILDAVRERRPPFSPDAVTQEFATLLKSYGLSRVTGDNYAGEWPKERFRTHGIAYDKSEAVRSRIYLDLLPMLNSGKVELLDNSRLVAQLAGLERSVAASGKDTVNHAKGAHDDLINAAAGALRLVGVAGRRAIRFSPEAIAKFASKPRDPNSFGYGGPDPWGRRPW